MSINKAQSLKGSVSPRGKLSGKLGIGNFIEDKTQTFILVDPDGNEVPAVITDEFIALTATPASDIRAGTTAVTADGIVIGEKEIPSYHTAEGYRAVPKGSRLTIPHVHYDYEKLQVVICSLNTSLANSVAAIKVALEDNVYDVKSSVSISTIIKDDANSRVDLGIVNDTENICVIRYFMYKEIY